MGGGGCACANVAGGRVPGLPRVRILAAGRYHSLAGDQSGRVWSWGLDACAQSGSAGTARGLPPHLVRS
jgi:alpha-tubulin suppressor-like RCC1 family protein